MDTKIKIALIPLVSVIIGLFLFLSSSYAFDLSRDIVYAPEFTYEELNAMTSTSGAECKQFYSFGALRDSIACWGHWKDSYTVTVLDNENEPFLMDWGDSNCPSSVLSCTTTIDSFALILIFGYPYSVSKTGNGLGTITSSLYYHIWYGTFPLPDWLPAAQDPAIDCGSSCSGLFAKSLFFYGYSRGTGITYVGLTPTPDPGSVFTGWSGDCTGTGTCILPATTSRSVIANFEPAGMSLKKGDPSGDGQEAGVNGKLADPLVVKVVDENGDGVEEVGLKWTITGPPTATGHMVDGVLTTGIDGSAQGTVTLGSLVGDYEVTVTCEDCAEGSPQIFTAIAKSCANLKLTTFNDPFPAGAGGSNKVSIIAEVGEPAPEGGCEIEFEEPEPVIYSGGHLHHDDRDNNRGTLQSDSGKNQLGKTICVIEKGWKFCSINFSASQVSGEELVVATVSGAEETAEVTIEIKVPGLQPLPPGVSYRLVGRYGEPGVESLHVQNHYAAPVTLSRMPTISDQYFIRTGYMLRINDISLPWGGIFDIFNTWDPDHDWHRVGKSVDISTRVEIYGSGGGLKFISCVDDYVLAEKVEGKNLGDLICESGGRKHIEFP